MSELPTAQYSKADFLDTTTPYERLWALKDNPFKMRQAAARMEELASSLGILKKFQMIWSAYQIAMSPGKATLSMANTTAFPGQPLVLKCENYMCDDGGVYLANQDGSETCICRHPIMPTKRIINLDSGECKTEIAWRRSNVWRRQVFDASVTGSAQKIVALKSVGIAVNSENAKQMVAFLGTLEDLNWDVLAEQKSIGRLGWMEEGFSPYVDNVMFDGQEQFRHAFEAVKTKGSYDVWLDCIRRIRGGNGLAARIMLASSFASVLIRKYNALPFIVHAWSNISGTGKTVSLMAAASVWAYPQRGEYVKTYNATNVGIEMSAGFYSDLPLCMDELQLRGGKRESFDATIYQFCEGVGRTRGSKTGGLQKTMSWNNCMISTGEEPLTSGSSRAGAVNRVIDIGCGDVKQVEDPIGTVAILTGNYGFAGRIFVESLTEENLAALKKVQEAYYDQLDGKATDKQRLSASLILAADYWAEKVIFQDGRVLTLDDLLPYLQSEADVDVNARAYEWLMGAIGINSEKFDANGNGERWGMIDEQAGQAYIIKGAFDRLMQDEGYNSLGFLQWARHKKLLSTDGAANDPRLTKKKRLPGIKGPQNCVCIKLMDDVPADVDPVTGYVVVEEQENMWVSA